MDNKEGLTLVKTTDEEYNVDYEGRRQGKCIKFTESGKIFIKCNFVDNELDGEYIQYYPDTYNIYVEYNYSKGFLDGEYIFHIIFQKE